MKFLRCRLGICLLVSTINLWQSSLISTQDANCDPVYIKCPCGQIEDYIRTPTIRIFLKTCYNKSNIGRPCNLCDGQTVEDACSKFRQCDTCGEGLERCLTCPVGKYGQWCDKECKCENDGACDRQTENCICQNGFTGKQCELVVVTKVDDSLTQSIQHSHMSKRQTNSSQELVCPLIPPPDNGHVHMEASIPVVGEAVKYTCQENYTMMGSSTRHCLRTGHWAGDAPTCEKLCSYPVIDPYVKVNVNPNRAGAPLLTTLGNEVLAELEFSCDFGFVLVGASRIRCASGVWDQSVPKCAASPECPDPGVPENGERTVRGLVKATYKIGTQLFYSCLANYTLVGSANITCMPYSQWSSPIPLCVPNVISDCVVHCNSASATVLNVAERPLVCSLESNMEAHVILHPEKDANDNPLEN